MKAVKRKLLVLAYLKLAKLLYKISGQLERKANYYSFMGNGLFSYRS